MRSDYGSALGVVEFFEVHPAYDRPFAMIYPPASVLSREERLLFGQIVAMSVEVMPQTDRSLDLVVLSSL